LNGKKLSKLWLPDERRIEKKERAGDCRLMVILTRGRYIWTKDEERHLQINIAAVATPSTNASEKQSLTS
jgi:hypothetical protein